MEIKVIIIINLIWIILDIKQKTKYENKFKIICTLIENHERQKSHPFGVSEKRFTWVNIYSNGNDLKNRQKEFEPILNISEANISQSFSKIKLENDKKYNENFLKKFLNNKKERKNYKYKYENINSKRVVNPEKDKEIKTITKKKTYENFKNNLFYTTNGSFSSLFHRTPWIIKNKGKKILNYSVDYGRKRDTDIFSESFLYDKKYDRIPGVLRKGCVPNIEFFAKQLTNIKKNN